MIETLKNISLILAVIAMIAPFATIVIAPDLFVKEMVFGMIYATVYLIVMGGMDYLEKRQGW